MFGLFPAGPPCYENNERVLPAAIVIGSFTEPLHIPLSWWSLEEYRKSWRKSLEEGLQRQDHAALAVSMYPPDNTHFVFTWVIYFGDKQVFVQNSILFLDEWPGFHPDNINRCIQPRTTHTDEGDKISEWETTLQSVTAFYHSLRA